MPDLDRTLRQMARKESRGFGVVPAWQTGQPKYANYNIEQLTEEGYRKNSIVSACISMIATSAPEAKIRIYRDTADGPKEVPDHWFMELMKQPNPHMSAFELWEWAHTFLNTGGASYWEIVRPGLNPGGEIVEIYPLRPDRIRILPSADDYIAGFEYHINGSIVFYQPWEILMIKFPDPLDEFYGLSPIRRVMRELGIDNEATDFTSSFLQNMAVPYGLLTSEQHLQEADAERIRSKWWSWFKGRNKGKPAVLGQGIQYQQIGMNFNDMEFESLRSMTETRICGAFGVDPVLLPSWTGIKYGGKYSNYAEARKHLWDETIVPALRRIESKITSQLLAGEDVYAKFDLSDVQALQEDETERVTRINTLWVGGLLTQNEARAELGWAAVEDGDKFNTASGGVEPPEPENPEPKNPTAGTIDEDEEEDQEKGFFFDQKLVPTDFLTALHTIQDKLEPLFKEELKQFFLEQKKDIVSVFDGQKSEQMDIDKWDQYEKTVAAKVLSWALKLTPLSTKSIKNILVAGGSIAASFFKIPFNGTSPDVLSYLERYIPKFVNSVTTITLQDLRSVMVKAQVEGWGMPKIRDEIKAKYNDYSEKRADMIAKTETIRSSNMGARMSYKAAGATEVEWLATADPRCCDFCCGVMNGKRVGIDEAFARVGETLTYTDNSGKTHKMKLTYDDIMAAPLHPRCRCTILPVVE